MAANYAWRRHDLDAIRPTLTKHLPGILNGQVGLRGGRDEGWRDERVGIRAARFASRRTATRDWRVTTNMSSGQLVAVVVRLIDVAAVLLVRLTLGRTRPPGRRKCHRGKRFKTRGLHAQDEQRHTGALADQVDASADAPLFVGHQDPPIRIAPT
jgi:hypothetical protein